VFASDELYLKLKPTKKQSVPDKAKVGAKKWKEFEYQAEIEF